MTFNQHVPRPVAELVQELARAHASLESRVAAIEVTPHVANNQITQCLDCNRWAARVKELEARLERVREATEGRT